MNRPYWMDFLDNHMCMPGNNILQDIICIILLSLEMTALKRLFVIIHITICLSTRWLAGKCHIFADYNWYVRSMEIMVDELETALEDIYEE